jgi:hypothetical protein
MSRYTMDAQDIYDEDRPLRDTDIVDRLNEQDEAIDSLHALLRQIRRWIESENKPGEWTSEIYAIAGKALPY